MATRFGNVKGIKFMEEPLGANRGGVALITFDIAPGATIYTGGTDTLQLGSASGSQAYENGVLSVPVLTLATMLQNRRRDGRTVVLDAATIGPAPGAQSAALNGPLIYPQTVAISAGNATLNLFNLPTGGSAITTTSAQWDRASTIVVQYTATYPNNIPE
jgi:hypothetical protein